MFNVSSQALAGEGWAGFEDVQFLLVFVGRLLLATALAIILAYHPKAARNYKSIADVNAPKSFILYALIAAIIGTAVLKFGGMVGFVIFGIGGLFRFRTNIGAASQTGRVILVTVIGLCAGLDLPHVAILSTLFAFILIWIIDGRTTHCLIVHDVHKKNFDDVSGAYRNAISELGGKPVGEDCNTQKHTLTLLFRTPSRLDRDELANSISDKVADVHSGPVQWE